MRSTRRTFSNQDLAFLKVSKRWPQLSNDGDEDSRLADFPAEFAFGPHFVLDFPSWMARLPGASPGVFREVSCATGVARLESVSSGPVPSRSRTPPGPGPLWMSLGAVVLFVPTSEANQSVITKENRPHTKKLTLPGSSPWSDPDSCFLFPHFVLVLRFSFLDGVFALAAPSKSVVPFPDQ